MDLKLCHLVRIMVCLLLIVHKLPGLSLVHSKQHRVDPRGRFVDNVAYTFRGIQDFGVYVSGVLTA